MPHSMFSISGRTVRTALGTRFELETAADDAIEFAGGVLVVLLAPSSLEPSDQNVLAIDLYGKRLWRAEPAATPYFGGAYTELRRHGAFARLIAADGHSTIIEPASGQVVRRFSNVEVTPPI